MSESKGTAVIDWFSFTFSAWPNMPESVPEMVRQWLFDFLGVPILGESGNGLYGFEHSVSFSAYNFGETTNICQLAWGGANQRGRVYVSLNGSGCALVKDWHIVHALVKSLPDIRLTRVDVAVDALNGELDIRTAREWYDQGDFNAGGRRPTASMVDDLGTNKGSTLYIGKRENGKFARIYEKGKQLGDSSSPWNRFEVELHNRDREIPLDICVRPSEYFAGCYPCCQGLVDVGAERIRTIRAEMEISLARLRTYCRIAYGKLINVISVRSADDPATILESLTVPGVPRRLEKSALAVVQSEASAASLSPGVHHHAISS